MAKKEQPRELQAQSEQIDFWQALNAAALTLQQASYSETAVYEAFATQLDQLGIYGAINLINESGTLFEITAVVMSAEQQKRLNTLQKSSGVSLIGHQFQVDSAPTIQQTFETATPCFLPDNTKIITGGLANFTRPVVKKFLKELGSMPVILTPIFREARPIGVLFVSSPILKPENLPAISAFSNHLSIALDNAALFQSLHNETEAIRQREIQLRLLAENVPGVIYLCKNNPTFDMIYLNDGVEMLTGYPKEKFLSRELSFRDLYHPDDSEFIQPEKEQRSDEAETYHHVYRIRHRSGAWRWVEEFGKSIYDENGRMLFLEGNIGDITERRQAEILQSTLYRIATVANADLSLEQMYPAIHAIMGDLMDVQNFYIALLDEKSNLLTLPYFVDEMDEHDGQPFDGSGGITDYVIHTGQPQLLSRMDIKQLLKKDLLRPLGSLPEIWLGVPLRTKAHVFGAIVVQSYHDASVYSEREKQLLFFVSGQVSAAIERKRSEEQLRQMAEEIKTQSRMFEEVLSTTPDQFIVYDLQGRIIFASPVFVQFMNLPVEEILGKTIAEIGFLPQELIEQTNREREQVIRTGCSLSGEIQVPSQDTTLDIEYILSPIRDDEGQVTAVVSSSRDITERNQTKAALHHAQKLESLAILSGGVAHDFNNLLVGMLAQNSLARAKLPEDSPAIRHLEKAESAAEKAALLTKQLLAYSGQGQFTIQPVDLNALLRENFQLFQAAISSHVQLKLDLAPKLSAIDGDAAQLQQMLINLILNGNEAIGNRPGIITVATKTCFISEVDLKDWDLTQGTNRAGSYVCLEVHDNGDGMDEVTISRIFEPFFTTKFTGRGLGLAAVSGIVRGHKGGLKVKSEPDAGTQFKMIFAAAESEPATAVSHTQADDAIGYILVIDDEQPVRDAIKDILDLEGLSTLAAVDGRSGVALYQERWPEISLVLLDISLPDMRGEEVYLKLKEINPQVRIILSSGFSEGETMEGIDPGQVDFLQKPYSFDQFMQIVSARLELVR